MKKLIEKYKDKLIIAGCVMGLIVIMIVSVFIAGYVRGCKYAEQKKIQNWEK